MSASSVRPAASAAQRAGTAYGGLIWTLIRTDFKTRYHGTVGGFIWALLKPVSMFLVLMSVFSFIFAQDPHYKLNLIIGLFLWDCFAEGTRLGMISLHQKGFLINKARFPLWIIVVTSISNAVITLLVFAVTVVIFIAVTRGIHLWAVPLFLLYVVDYLLIIIGISLGGSVLFLRYRDLNQVWEVFSQAGFFLAPIVYPLGILPERLHIYLYLWPVTPIVQFSRQVLVEGTVPTMKAHLMLFATTGLVFGTGLLLFRRYSRRAAEQI